MHTSNNTHSLTCSVRKQKEEDELAQRQVRACIGMCARIYGYISVCVPVCARARVCTCVRACELEEMQVGVSM